MIDLFHFFPNPLIGFMEVIIDVTGLPVTFALLGTILFFSWINVKIVKMTIRITEG